MDSGVSDHMTHRKDWFASYRKFGESSRIRIGDRAFLENLGIGKMIVSSFDGKEWHGNHLTNVLYVPDPKYNHFSSGSVMDRGFQMESDSRICRFEKQDRIFATAEQMLFVMKIKVSETNDGKSQSNDEVDAAAESIDTWQQ